MRKRNSARDLLAQIETFCRDYDMAPTVFGQEAKLHPAFISRLRKTKNCTLKNADRAFNYMMAYRERHPLPSA